MNGWMDWSVDEEIIKIIQVIRLVELSKIKCLLELYYFKDVLSFLSLSLSLYIYIYIYIYGRKESIGQHNMFFYKSVLYLSYKNLRFIMSVELVLGLSLRT